jgi:hypothetical protein
MPFRVLDQRAIQQVTNWSQGEKKAGNMIQIRMLNVKKCSIIALIM